jgi:PPOX class probable F420-dependent enzyme
VQLDEDEARRRLVGADHGVLATLHPERGIDAVPVCFAVVGDHVAVPIDRVKPKRTTVLQRTANLALDPRATLLCERWDPDDWSQLWWVRAHLRRLDDDEPTAVETRPALSAALQDRYEQYRTAPFATLLVLRVERISGWSAEA